MKATPAYLMYSAFLSCSMLFCQENVSNLETSMADSKVQESIYNSTNLLINKRKTHSSYTEVILKASKQSIKKIKTSHTNTKIISEVSKKTAISIPRTTLDFY